MTVETVCTCPPDTPVRHLGVWNTDECTVCHRMIPRERRDKDLS